MSTDLIKFIEIRNLFLNIPNNNYQFKKKYNLTIEEEIVCQLLIFISTILKNKISNCEIELKKQIITESLNLLKKIKPSVLSNNLKLSI